MKKKTQQSPSLLDEALDMYSNIENTRDVTNMDTMETIVDIEKLIQDKNDVDDDTEDNEPDLTKVKPEDDNTQDTIDSSDEDDSEIPDDVRKRMNGQTVDNTTDVNDKDETTEEEDVSDLELNEAQQVTAFFDAIAEHLGIEANDDEKPVTVEEFTDYIDNIVKENSVPQYADDRIKNLDEFVKNGGKFEDFYQIQSQQMDYENIDLEEESNQKAVIREFYKTTTSMSDEKINRRLERLEDADMLEEEAEDALDNLKTIRQEQMTEMQKQQEAYRVQQEEQQRAFFNDVSTKIKNLKSVHGIAVANEDKQVLFDYIFKPDREGKTQYQKDFEKNLSKNLIESAYYMMKGDELMSRAKKTGESSAANKLRNILRHQSKNHSTYNADDKQKSVVDLASRYFN